MWGYTILVALPPTIPTSFVPRAPIQTSQSLRPQIRQRGANPINVIGMILLVITLAGGGAVYGYQQYLSHLRDSKAAELLNSQKKIDQGAVQSFTRLRDRLSLGTNLLAQHVTVSEFFTALESLTLKNVEFDTLEVAVGDDRTTTIKITGLARTFNALAAQSSALNSDPRMKHVIFSGIKANEKGFIVFSVAAQVVPELVTGGISVSALAPGIPTQAQTVTAPTSFGVVATTSVGTSTASTTSTTTKK